MATVKWGIVGCGDIAQKAVAPVMTQDVHSTITAFCSHDLQRARELADMFGADAAYDNYEQMLADDRVEAIYVASPVHRHCTETVQACRAQKHVLCEKPMALTTDECRQMIEAAHEGDVHLEIAYCRRFWSKTQKMKELISDGAIGRPLSARLRVGRLYNPAPDDYKHWRVEMDKAGGGSMQDVGSHRLDVMCYLLGAPVRAAGLFDTFVMGYEVPDTETLMCQFEGGTHLVAEANWCIDRMYDEFEVRGSRGTLLATPFDGPTLRLDTYDGIEEFEVPEPGGYRHRPLIEEFTDAVSEGRTPAYSGYDGMLTTAIIDSAMESCESDQWVDIDV
ncbi:MAG: Gfo/Idh/MocA family oxidoreductase [Armatimonadota bacterium]